ncbi:MAG: agmatine deiminase family protein [Cyclobacteriaceae bacterium]
MKPDALVLPAEWHPQSAIQLTWPHEQTDWNPIIKEATECFVQIADEISQRQKLVVVCQDVAETKADLKACNQENITFLLAESDDTWARDHGGITVLKNEKPTILDFGFNGWGKKYHFEKDNRITRTIYESRILNQEVAYEDHLDFILEGGSIDSDGKGTILTTSSCFLSNNRNDKSKEEVEQYLKETLGATRILWLNHGQLVGDNTDGHIDTLARFCSEDTITYVKCDDPSDEHYDSLNAMEAELKVFQTLEGSPYQLIPLPMADAVYYNDQRLPATYANFLIMNAAVLLPLYGTQKDEEARVLLQSAFPTREVIGINCSSLIKQGGSLHCLTMQYPEGVL